MEHSNFLILFLICGDALVNSLHLKGFSSLWRFQSSMIWNQFVATPIAYGFSLSRPLKESSNQLKFPFSLSPPIQLTVFRCHYKSSLSLPVCSPQKSIDDISSNESFPSSFGSNSAMTCEGHWHQSLTPISIKKSPIPLFSM